MSENKETPEVVEESPKGGCGCHCSCGGAAEDEPYVWENQAPPSPPAKKRGRSLLLILLLGMLFAGGLSMATAMAGDGSAPKEGAACEGSACPVMRLKEAVFPAKSSCGDKAGKDCGEKAGACPVSGAASGEAKLQETAAPRVDASLPAATVDASLAANGECPADKKSCCKGKSCGGKDKDKK